MEKNATVVAFIDTEAGLVIVVGGATSHEVAVVLPDVVQALQDTVDGPTRRIMYTHAGNSFLGVWGFENRRPGRRVEVRPLLMLSEVGVSALGRRTAI